MRGLHSAAALLGLLILALTLGSQTASAGQYQLVHTFQAEVPEVGDLFGTAVAFEGNVAAIRSNAAWGDSDPVSTTHVFEQVGDTWSEASTFDLLGRTDNSRGNYPYTGQELAVNDGVVGIGFSSEVPSPGIPGAGAVWFASRGADGWKIDRGGVGLTDRLNISSNEFPPGRSLEISDGFAIVSDPYSRAALRVLPDGSIDAQRLEGGARIYEQSADGLWRLSSVLVPSGPITGAHTVALSGSLAATVTSGGLFFFERTDTGGWTETTSILAPFSNRTRYWSTTVEMDGDTAVQMDLLSAPTEVPTIYERNGAGEWELSQRLEPPDGRYYGYSRASLAIEGDLIAITSMGNDDEPNVVDLYQREAITGQWSLLESITDPRTTGAEHFGASLALDQGRLLVGAHTAYDPDDQSSPGAAYLFAVVPEPSSLLLLATASLFRCRRSRQRAR